MLGIFDSGIGGLTVVKELLRRHPDAAFAYLGDTARTPYGTKGGETIIRYALEDAAYLVRRGATNIVVACNTASAYAMPALRERFPDATFIDVIQPAVQAALNVTRGHVGVIGTNATIRSGVYEKELHQRNDSLQVSSVACPLFVPLVEEGWLDGEIVERIVERYIDQLKEQQIDTLILGCTHYPLLQPVIQSVLGPNVRIIDSPSAVLDAMDIELPNGEQAYAFTDQLERVHELARAWLGIDIRPEQVSLEE